MLDTIRDDIKLNDLKDFNLDHRDFITYTQDETQLNLVTEDHSDDPKPYSRDGDESLVKANFTDTGRMYLAPNITYSDELTLRKGGNISTPKTASLNYHFQYKNADGNWEWRSGAATVTAKDYSTANDPVFFGDRPLVNPGYSAFKLLGEVGVGADVLDVYRVEQRLKYLGYPAMGYGNPTLENNQIQDFTVDGRWGAKESHAAHLFDSVINYDSSHRQLATPNGRYVNGVWKKATDRTAYFNALDAAANNVQISQGNANHIVDYLNAYNAPHWMNIGSQMESQAGSYQSEYSIPGWNNNQSGQSAENYGTSWMRDLMVAGSSYAPFGLRETLTDNRYGFSGARNSFWLNGSVDANHGYTPFTHGTHDLGMAFDLGVSQYIYKEGEQKNRYEQLTLDTAMITLGQHLNTTLFYPSGVDPNGVPDTSKLYDHIPNKTAYWNCQWDYDNALYLSGLLPATQSPDRARNDQVSALRDALALYAVTRSETWSGLNIASDRTTDEETQIRAALFGDGSKAESLISQIIIGANAFNNYPNIHEVLMRLGITSGLDAQHHFHIYLNPPEAVDIVSTQNVMVDGAPTDGVVAAQAVVQTDSQGLLDYAQSIVQGEELMFIMDVPAAPVQETPIVLAQTDTTGASPLQPDYILKYCTETASTGDSRSAMRAVDPAGMLRNYLQNRDKHAIELSLIKNISLLENTKHGEITTEVDNTGLTFFGYDPEPEYVGRDRAVFMAEYQGVRYKIVVDLRVFLFVDEKAPVCPPPQLIKVNKPSSGNSGYDLNSISISFGTLDGSRRRPNHRHTPSPSTPTPPATTGSSTPPPPTTANSSPPPTPTNGWRRRAVPPTARWTCSPYCCTNTATHLGIEHSADNHDYMATTLTPGVRRMPSADEMALMQQLVAQVKGDTVASSPSWFDGLTTNGSGDAPSPIPLPLPLGGSLGLAFLGRLRSSRYGGMNIEGVLPYAPTTHYEVAANAAFTNLDAPAGWNTQGGVDIAPHSTPGQG